MRGTGSSWQPSSPPWQLPCCCAAAATPAAAARSGSSGAWCYCSRCATTSGRAGRWRRRPGTLSSSWKVGGHPVGAGWHAPHPCPAAAAHRIPPPSGTGCPACPWAAPLPQQPCPAPPRFPLPCRLGSLPRRGVPRLQPSPRLQRRSLPFLRSPHLHARLPPAARPARRGRNGGGPWRHGQRAAAAAAARAGELAVPGGAGVLPPPGCGLKGGPSWCLNGGADTDVKEGGCKGKMDGLQLQRISQVQGTGGAAAGTPAALLSRRPPAAAEARGAASCRGSAGSALRWGQRRRGALLAPPAARRGSPPGCCTAPPPLRRRMYLPGGVQGAGCLGS